jgi:hypothetical protein
VEVTFETTRAVVVLRCTGFFRRYRRLTAALSWPPAERTSYGRTLPRVLREAGLEDVGADAYFPITSSACAVLETATVQQIRSRLVAEGLATDEEVDWHLSNVATG